MKNRIAAAAPLAVFAAALIVSGCGGGSTDVAAPKTFDDVLLAAADSERIALIDFYTDW